MPKKRRNDALRVSGNVLDYYMKYGRERELEKFMRFQSPSTPTTSASSNEEWTRGGNLNHLFHEKVSSMHAHDKETKSQSMPIISSTSSEHKEHIIPIQLEDDIGNTSEENILSTSNTPTKTPPRQHAAPSKQSQTPESVVKVHKRLEWDSLADVGYKKSKSTGNISKVERMVLKELFEVTSQVSKAANSSENDIRFLEQEIADLHILKKHFTKPTLEYDEAKYHTPPLASSTQLETRPGTSQPKIKNRTSKATNTTALLQKYEKYAQTSLRESVEKTPVAKSTSIGTNTSTIVQKNEKYAQTTVNSPEMISQEVQVTLTSNASSSYLGSSAEPSSFEYHSRHSTDSNGAKLPSVSKANERSKAGETKKSNVSKEKHDNNKEPRKALGTKNTNNKGNDFCEESNELKRLYCTWQGILDDDKENSSSSSCTTTTSSAPAIELGIQLICSIMKAKTLNSKQKNKLIKNIVKRITKIANSRELHDIVSRTALLYGNEQIDLENIQAEKGDRSSKSTERNHYLKENSKDRITEPPPVPKHRELLAKDLLTSFHNDQYEKDANTAKVPQQSITEITSESSYIKEVRKDLRTAFQDDELEEATARPLPPLPDIEENCSLTIVGTQIAKPSTFKTKNSEEATTKRTNLNKDEKKKLKSESNRSKNSLKTNSKSKDQENIQHITVEEIFSTFQREQEEDQHTQSSKHVSISPSTLMKTEREILKDFNRQQFNEAVEKHTQRMKNQEKSYEGFTREDSVWERPVINHDDELNQPPAVEIETQNKTQTDFDKDRFIEVSELEKYQQQVNKDKNLKNDKEGKKAKEDTKTKKDQKATKPSVDKRSNLSKKSPKKSFVEQTSTKQTTAVQTQNQSPKKIITHQEQKLKNPIAEATHSTGVQTQKKSPRKLPKSGKKFNDMLSRLKDAELPKYSSRIASGDSSKQITAVQFQSTSSSTISTATSTQTSAGHHKSVQVILSVARDGTLISAKTSEVPSQGSSTTMTSTLSSISSTSKDYSTQKTVKPKNDVNMQEWLEPMTQTEIDAEKKNQGNIQKRRSRSKVDKIDECREVQLNWIECEIQRLQNLRNCLLNDTTTSTEDDLKSDKLKSQARQQQHPQQTKERRPSNTTQTSEKLYDTVYSDKSHSKSDASTRSKRVTISTEPTQKPNEIKNANSQQRSKIDTPSTESNESESVESLLSRRKQKLRNLYEPQSTQYCCATQVYNDGPSTSTAAAAAACTAPQQYVCQNYGQYSMPHTMQRNVPTTYYTYPPISQTQIQSQPQYYTEPCIYPTVQTQPPVQATCTAPQQFQVLQCTQTRIGRQPTSSTAFRGSSELTVPMGSYASSSTPTTTHQYDDVAAAAVAAAALRHNNNVASQTGPSLQRSRPIYETRCSPKYSTTGNVMSYATYMPSCGQVAANTVCVQAQPRATAYAVQFVIRGQSESSSQSTSSPTTSTSQELRILAAQAGPSLQLALQQRRPQFVQNAKDRKSVINRIQKMRQEREKKLREIADENLSATTLDKKLQNLPPPVTEQVRLFSTKEMKAMTKKRVSKLPEVLHGQDRQKDERKKRTNRLLREVYNRRLQENVRKGKLDIKHSHTLI